MHTGSHVERKRNVLPEPEKHTLNSAGRGDFSEVFGTPGLIAELILDKCSARDICSFAATCGTNFENVRGSRVVERKRALQMALTSWKRQVTESRHKLIMDRLCVCHTVCVCRGHSQMHFAMCKQCSWAYDAFTGRGNGGPTRERVS